MTLLQEIIKKAHTNLPVEKKSKPWSFINHGVDILQTEDELNCYLAAYGLMHEEKVTSALESFIQEAKNINNRIHVIDWGCGQGLATLCLIETLDQWSSTVHIESISLIEPSQAALKNASIYVNDRLKNKKITVNLIQKHLNDVEPKDIKISETVTIHLFSNILDIGSVSIDRLTELIKQTLTGDHYFICVGPMNYGATRIDEFAKSLNVPEKQILGSQSGKLKTNRGTIKSLVFKITGAEITVIKSVYYPPMPKNKNYMHILGNLLNKVIPSENSLTDNIVEYYKTVVELEQIKEPEIKQYYEYDYELSDSNEFLIDLQKNTNFLTIFQANNADTYPKDLVIAIILESGGRKKSFLSYAYLFDDIKGFNPALNKMRINLSDFELNYGTLSNLEKTSDEINALEERIKQQSNIGEIIQILNNNLDQNYTFNNKLSLALSSKNPALLQTHSELRKLKDFAVQDEILLKQFLLNSPFKNPIGKFQIDDLIKITYLDHSQEKAVLNALNNKVSVITGPPGSGKTQVIANVLANAVLQNKKVLVASKINQAVDNVKSRFDREEEIGFFLRFGNRDILNTTTLPSITKHLTLKASLTNNDDALEKSIDELKKIVEIKRENTDKLELRNKLEIELPELEKSIKHVRYELESLVGRNSHLESLRANHSAIEIDNINTQFKHFKNTIELRYSGIRRVWFDWFYRRKAAADYISFFNHLPIKIREYLNVPSEIAYYKTGHLLIESFLKTIKMLDSLIDYHNKYNEKNRKLKEKQQIIELNKSKINEINEQEQTIKQTIKDCEVRIITQSNLVLSNKIKNKLYHSSTPAITHFVDFIPQDVWKHEYVAATKTFLNTFNISSVTSLSAKACLPLSSEVFDMVIIDEASQCDIASALPLILRAKQLIVIGDPLQLKHITTIEDYEEEKVKEHLHLSHIVHLHYKNKSLWDYSRDFLSNADVNSSPIELNYHYRCHPQIIEYSKEAFYKSILKDEMQICTKAENFPITPKGIRWEDVKGVHHDAFNINIDEVNKCIELATQILAANPTCTIGIITPFRDQADKIKQSIPVALKDQVVADTVYKFQGDEKPIIIYSLVVTNNSPASKIKWIDSSPELINVAVTRARNTIYIVGNKSYILTNSDRTSKPLGRLASYADTIN